MRDAVGNIVPVSVGNSSRSNTDDEVKRILGQLRDAETSGSNSQWTEGDSSTDDGIYALSWSSNANASDHEIADISINLEESHDNLSNLFSNGEEGRLFTDDEIRVVVSDGSNRSPDHLSGIVDDENLVVSGGRDKSSALIVVDGYQSDDEWSGTTNSDDENECISSSTTREQQQVDQNGQGFDDRWDSNGQVTGTARGPNSASVSQIRVGVLDRACMGGGTTQAVGSVDDNNCNYLDEGVQDHDVIAGKDCVNDCELEEADSVASSPSDGSPDY